MSFRNIRPLHILWQELLKTGMLDGVASGIRNVISFANVSNEIKLKYLGKRRQGNYLDERRLPKPHQSLDWYIMQAHLSSAIAGHLNSATLLNSLLENPTHETEPRYELVVVNQPLHWHDTSKRIVGGIGRCGQGAVITLHPHLNLLQAAVGESDEWRRKRLYNFFLATKILTMHELGHVFGLYPGTGKENPSDEELKNSHCLKDCVMYWQHDAEFRKKIELFPFCPDCLEKLKKFFVEP